MNHVFPINSEQYFTRYRRQVHIDHLTGTKYVRPNSFTHTPGKLFPRFSSGKGEDLILVYDLETTTGVDVTMKPYLITFTIFRINQ